MDQKAARLGNLDAFVAVTALFFAWGFISSNTDPLIVALRGIFSLNYVEGLLTQLVFFLAYGFFSLPAAALVARVGAPHAIPLALMVMIAGCLLVGPASGVGIFPAILAALFVLASGITLLQVAANPLMAALGPVETSHFRLTFAQAFNSLGVVLGVHFGAQVMLGGGAVSALYEQATDPALRSAALDAVVQAFFAIGAALSVVLVSIWLLRNRIRAAMHSPPALVAGGASVLAALRSPWARFGAVSIGLYVGAEVSIGSIMINFLHEAETLSMPFVEGGQMLANYYWGGALVGRFAGALMLRYIPASRMLAGAATAAVLLCSLVVISSGTVAAVAALSVGLFNSIMFPTIFTLTLERSGVSHEATSGLLCLAIVGGAILPLLVGLVADGVGLSFAFMVPTAAYLVIAAFAVKATKAAPGKP